MPKKRYEEVELEGYLLSDEVRRILAQKHDTDPSSIDLLVCRLEKKEGRWFTFATYIA